MITRAVVCPSPPLLATDLTGRATVLPDLSKACADAVGRLIEDGPGMAGPDSVAIVAGGPSTATWGAGSHLDLAAYGPSALTGQSSSLAGQAGSLAGAGEALPLGLGLGAMLLDATGYTGPRRLHAIAEDASAAECLRLGASLAGDTGLAGDTTRTALLVVGDGSARRDPKAPGHLDERAAPFDMSVELAFRARDMAALAGLDPRLARELMAAGRAAWQVLAGALGAPFGPSPAVEVLYSDAPFGVWYLVAVLDPS